MEFRILGPLEARLDDRLLPLRGQKQKALLAILLLNANQVVSSDRIVDELWPDEPPESGLNALQAGVSRLRKALGAAGDPHPIVTRAPGYVAQVDPGQLDLLRFERLAAQARSALEKGDPATAADRFRQALALWRGPALADLTYESFAEAAIVRLEELRVSALEQRIEADLALGRHAELVGELEALVGDNPLRERLRRQLMLALYRSGRQAEALQSYRAARQALVEQIGIEPGPGLRELESAILRQDKTLDLPRTSFAPRARGDPPERSILVVSLADLDVVPLLEVAEPLAARPLRELILVRLVDRASDLDAASKLVSAQRPALRDRGVVARTTAFTSSHPGEDVVRMALDEAVDLLLIGGPPEYVATGTPTADLETILERAPCDVGVLVAAESAHGGTDAAGPILAPFGGAEHDWAAIELAAWVARAQDVPLRLLGTDADAQTGTRDASRLLARASLVVQRVTDVVAEPQLVPPGAAEILRAAEGAGLLVVGLSTRKRRSGLGEVRLGLLQQARLPVLLVRKGLRPGGIAPSESLTRFTWSLTQLSGAAPAAHAPAEGGKPSAAR